MYLFYLILVAFSNHASAQLNVIYPNVNGIGEHTFGYAVLQLALENSGRNFTLKVSNVDVNNARIRIMLQQNKISISDFGTSPEYEQDLLPIYFPIDMGLNGWRIFLIHRDAQFQFENIGTIEDLRKKSLGQGLGWSDIEVLENAGLNVEQAPNLTNLFKMTENKRFDCFPLGANEVHSLLDRYQKFSPNVIVEPKVLLIYPFGRLFFVDKENQELHDAVFTGLVRSFENGSFWKLFKSHESNKATFTSANLKGRQQIFIDNPRLTQAFKKIPKKYFFSLDMLD